MERYIGIVLKLLTILFMVLSNFEYVDSVNLSPALQTQLNKHGSAHVMLVMKHPIKHVVNSVNSRRFTDPNVRAATLVRELREFTRESQQNVLNFLGRRGPMGHVKPFWITNKISVRNATAQMIHELMSAHGDDILEIRAAVKITLDDPIPDTPGFMPGNMQPSPGIPAQAPPPPPPPVPQSVHGYNNMQPPVRPEQAPPLRPELMSGTPPPTHGPAHASSQSLPENMSESRPEFIPPPKPEHIPENPQSSLSEEDPPFTPDELSEHAPPSRPQLLTQYGNLASSILASRPPLIHIPAPVIVPERETKAAVTPWGVENINVAKAHKMGYNGQGVVVAIVDSGVRESHEILRHNKRPTYNWFDAYNKTNIPLDKLGHGTHCTGTAVGWGGFGVAPGSQWIACRIFEEDSAEEDIILLCAQWVTCPSLPDGTQEDCSMRPNVASNSWGGDHSDFFNDPILTWNAAGIITVFSIGNNGPGCRTTGSPGDQDMVISVGATNFWNVLSSFSSRGPSGVVGAKGKQKPDVSAPGRSIMSASNNTDDRYLMLSGTSMAAPHVTGTVALLLSKKPTATFYEIREVLQSTAFKPNVSPPPNSICTEGLQNHNVNAIWPNNLFGAGIIRADAALENFGNWIGGSRQFLEV